METVDAADGEAIMARVLHSLFLVDPFVMKFKHFWFCLGPLVVYFDLCALLKDAGRQKKYQCGRCLQ